MEETGGVHGTPKQQVASGHSIPPQINLLRVERREGPVALLSELTALTTAQTHQLGHSVRICSEWGPDAGFAYQSIICCKFCTVWKTGQQ